MWMFKRSKHTVIVAVLLCIISTGCGPTPMESEFSQMIKKTKKTHNASDVKNAAFPLINSTNQIVPKEIASLPLFASDGSEIYVSDLAVTNGKPQGILFWTGSGFGHWGIAVCPFPGGEKAARVLKGEITPWDDGVYFFLEH